MTGIGLKRLDTRLREFVEGFRPELGRRERRHWCGMYLRGLLLEGERKSIEPMAQRLEGGNEQALAESLCGHMIERLKIKRAGGLPCRPRLLFGLRPPRAATD